MSVKFDRSKILKTAWQIYRRAVSAGAAFSRRLFGEALRAAWSLTKSPMLNPEMFVAHLRNIYNPARPAPIVYRGSRYFSRDSLRLRASFGA